MKTNSRRRVLISSVAMLLVALVALSTATFAWFTTSTTTTASGLNVKTVKSSELVISKSDRAWGQTINYAQNDKVLRPASSSNGENWFSATAATKGEFTRTGDFTSVNSEKGSYVFVEELNIANKGEAAVQNVTISVSNFDNKYGRIALVPVTDQGVQLNGATYGEAFLANIYDTEGETYDAASGATTVVADVKANSKIEIVIPELAGKVGTAELGGAVYYDLYVWFEGQDEDCFDTNAGQSIGNITFTISGETIKQ
jgi:hypothetical protein